jgi:hypothetical protein
MNRERYQDAIGFRPTPDFGVPLDSAAAANAANYQVDTITTKKVKKKKETILHPTTNHGDVSRGE